MFYRSHKTEVHVCPSLANLYFGKAIRQNDHWKFAMTGIPVLVLDTGIHHRDRKLHIVLAEKGTGCHAQKFPPRMNYETDYDLRWKNCLIQ
jgi:hypothetical protein